MPTPASALRFPHQRVLLPRTKLAYVHLRNLLTDAKRDRAARVCGYVAIWLPEELVMLYLRDGELVNATATSDGRRFTTLPLAAALARVPQEPELGEVCFHEAAEEQLACMYVAQCGAPADEWPAEVDERSAVSLFPHLAGTTYDGVVEIATASSLNYLVFRDGTVQRGYMADGESGSLVGRVQRLFTGDPRRVPRTVRRWEGPPPLPAQAPPALIQAYRELVASLLQRLIAGGAESAPAIARAALQSLLPAHPALVAFGDLPSPGSPTSLATFGGGVGAGTAESAADVTAAVAAWVTELLWTATYEGSEPDALLREAARERRHAFQSAGFFDLLPWKVAW